MFHNFRVLKKFFHKRDMSRFCVENFLFLSTEKILNGTLLCFRELLVWKKIRDKKVGVSFYRRKFFVSRRRKLSWANTSLFENVSSREKIMDKRGGCHVFPSEIACPKSQKNIVGEPFCVSEIFLYQNFLDNKGITILSIVFVSHCRNFRGKLSMI